MTVTRELLLSKLPPFTDERVVVKSKQDVKDIIRLMIEAHKQNGWLYDRIAGYFEGGTVQQTCDNIHRFCIDNLAYVEESDKLQTVSVPQALLTWGVCDCKGYASFCCGVLSALTRRGAKIKWEYCFASYKPLDKQPYHVFTIVTDAGQETWIDPTPGADGKSPVWWIRKTVKNSDVMALEQVIGRIGTQNNDLPPQSKQVDNVPVTYQAQNDYAASVLYAAINNSQMPADTINAAPTSTLANNPSPTVHFLPPASVTNGASVVNTAAVPSTGPDENKKQINTLLLVAGGLGALYLLSPAGSAVTGIGKKGGKRKNKYLVPGLILAAGLGYWWYTRQKDEETGGSSNTDLPPVNNTPADNAVYISANPAPAPPSNDQAHTALFNYSEPWRYAVDRMTAAEWQDLYAYVFGYIKKGLHLYQYPGNYQDGWYDPALYTRILTLSNKWNLGLLY